MAAPTDQDLGMTDQNTFNPDKLPHALTPPETELRAKLERFVYLMRELTQSDLFLPNALSLRFLPRDDGLFDVECVAPLNDLEMRGLLTYFRQLWQDGEFAQFNALRGQLRQHVDASGLPASPELVEWLDDVGRANRRARRSFPDFGVLEAEIDESEVLRDEAVRAERILDDWVNGEVFHSDAEKNAHIDWAGDTEAYRFALLAAVLEITKVYVLFARMAKAILDEPALTPADF